MKSNSDWVQRDVPPVLFRIAKILERRGLRGSTRLRNFLHQTGQLDDPVEYLIGKSLSVLVPIGRNEYDRTDVDDYETDFLASLSRAISALPGPATLIDVGADIGLFSLKLLGSAPSISRIVAFEPNGDGFRWLKLNLDRLPFPCVALNAAAADFVGTGRLTAPDRQWSPGVLTNHTQYFLEAAPDGSIDVVTLDSLPALADGQVENLVLKVDVEGGELAVLRGASKTISAATRAIIAIEAHPGVAARTGIDPVEGLRLLSALRPFRFEVSESGRQLTTSTPVFEQIPPDQIYNVIACSI